MVTRFAGGQDTREVALVGAPEDVADRYLLSLGDHVLDLVAEVREGVLEHAHHVLEALPASLPVWWCGLVQEILGCQLSSTTSTFLSFQSSS